MAGHKIKDIGKEEMIKAFQGVGAFFLLLGVIALMDDVLNLMPVYMKAIVLYLIGFAILFYSNIVKEKEEK